MGGLQDKRLEAAGLLNYQTRGKSASEIQQRYQEAGIRVDQGWFKQQYGGAGQTQVPIRQPIQANGGAMSQGGPSQQPSIHQAEFDKAEAPYGYIKAGNSVNYVKDPKTGLTFKVPAGSIVRDPMIPYGEQNPNPTPPEFEFGATIDQALKGEANWTDVSVDTRKGLLSNPNFYQTGQIAKYPAALQQQILADPNFKWDQLPKWQEIFYSISSNPKIMASPMALAGWHAGSPFGLPGKVVGAAAGYGLGLVGGQDYDPTKGITEQPTFPAAAMRLLNFLSEYSEQGTGYVAQLADASIAGLQGNKQAAAAAKDILFDEATRKAAWEAGRVTYEYGDIGGRYVLNLLQALNGQSTYADGGEDFVLGSAIPVDKAKALGHDPLTGEALYYTDVMQVLMDARHEIRDAINAGQDGDEVTKKYLEAAGIYAGSQLQDLFWQSKVDPLNSFGEVTNQAGEVIARTGGNNVAAEALGSTQGLTEAARRYQTYVQTGEAAKIDPNFKLDQTGWISKMVAGVNDRGEIKAGSLLPTQTGLLDPLKGKPGFIQALVEQTPMSRAQQGAGMFYENISTLLTLFDDPHEAGKYLKALANNDMETWRELGSRFAESPEFYTVLPALKAFNSDALDGLIQAWDITQVNRDALTRVADVLGENPATLLDDLAKRGTKEQDFQRIVERLKASSDAQAKALMADIEAGNFTAETLADIVDVFTGEGALPWHPGQWKALMMDTLGDHFDEWITKRLMLDQSPEAKSAFFRTSALMKQAQSILLLGGSPGYALTNGMSNMVHRGVTGIYGYLSPTQINSFLDRMGVSPARMDEGVGIGGMVDQASGTSRVKMDEMNKAVKGKGPLTTAKDVLGKISKGMPFSKLSSWFEQHERRQANAIAMGDFWSRSWRRGVGFRTMSPDLVKVITDMGIQPDRIYAAIEAGMNQAEIEKALFGRREGIQSRSLIHDAAQRTGMSATNAAAMLEKIGVLDTLDTFLKGQHTPDGVRAAFTRASKQAQDWIDMQTGEDLKAKAEAVKQRVGLEGAAAALDVTQQASNYFMDAWMDHYFRFGEVFDDLKLLDDPAMMQRAIEYNYQLSDEEFRRINAQSGANYKGIFDAWGMSGNANALDVLAAIGEGDAAMKNAYAEMRRIRKEYFDTYGGDFENPARFDAWDAGQKGIDKIFKQAFAIKHQAEVKMGSALGKIYESLYGPAAGEAARLWWEDVVSVNDQIVKEEQAFRASLEGLTKAERSIAKKKFYSEKKMVMIAELEKVNSDGIARLERVIKGGNSSPSQPSPAPSPTPAPSGGGLTAEALAILQKIDNGGRMPTLVTPNLFNVAMANGVNVTPDMNARAVIDALRAKMTAAPAAEENLRALVNQQYESKPPPPAAATPEELNARLESAAQRSSAATNDPSAPAAQEINRLIEQAEQRRRQEAKEVADRVSSIWDVAERFWGNGGNYRRDIFNDKFALLGALRKEEYGGMPELTGLNDPRLTAEMVEQILERRKVVKDAELDSQVGQAITNAADAASNIKPPNIHENTTILAAIKEHGGIDQSLAADLTGERKPKTVPGVFTRKGVGIDEMARMLADDGYPINLEDPNDLGGIRQTTELINNARRGDKVYPVSHDHEAMLARAQENAAISAFEESMPAHEIPETINAKDLGIHHRAEDGLDYHFWQNEQGVFVTEFEADGIMEMPVGRWDSIEEALQEVGLSQSQQSEIINSSRTPVGPSFDEGLWQSEFADVVERADLDRMYEMIGDFPDELANSLLPNGETYTEYMSRMADLVAARVEAEARDQEVATHAARAEAAIQSQEIRAEAVVTRNMLKEKMQAAFGLDDIQARSYMELSDAVASWYARVTGENADAFYARYYKDVVKSDTPVSDGLFQAKQPGLWGAGEDLPLFSEAARQAAIESVPEVVQESLFDTTGNQEQRSAEAKPQRGLTDFGEKLGGARKDRVQFVEKNLSDADLAGMSLTEIWPKAEVDAIENVDLAAVATALRNEVPSKPRDRFKLKRWVETVKLVRDLLRHAEEKGVDVTLNLAKARTALTGFVDKVNLMRQIPREEWGRIGKVRDYPTAYTYVDGKQVPKPYAYAEVDGRSVQSTSFTALVDEVLARLNTKTAEPSAMKFEVRGNGKEFFINKKGDPLYRKLKTFNSTEEAFKFMRENHDSLVSAWEQVKNNDNVKETDVRRAENQPRTGKDHRQGKDATPDMFMDAFGFRGVEFGNWVSQGNMIKERQGMLNAAYDAMMDLSDILGVPSKAISLGGTLGLGLGSRGSGSASAHYEPSNIVINLTKTRGAGTFAHEWFHALDNYFQLKRGYVTGEPHGGSFITFQPETRYRHGATGQTISADRFEKLKARGGIRNPGEWELVKGVRPEVEKSFTDLVKALNDSPMAKRAQLVDKGQSGYWSRTIERAARSFENFVIEKMAQQGYKNDYLANVASIEDFERDPGRYPYLLDNELAPVVKAFDDLFTTVEARETARGVELFQDDSAPKGAVTFDETGIKATIHAFEASDFSTLIHENAHIFRRVLKDVAERTGNDRVRADLATIEEWAGVVDGQWYRSAEEKFARGFEQYIREGRAPTPKLARAFEMFRTWMLQIYQTITGSAIDVKMSDDVRDVFDRMLGKQSVDMQALLRDMGYDPKLYYIDFQGNVKERPQIDIKVDRDQVTEEVNALTETDWFQGLTSKIHDLRGGRGPEDWKSWASYDAPPVSAESVRRFSEYMKGKAEGDKPVSSIPDDELNGDILKLAEKEGIYGHPGGQLEKPQVQARRDAIEAVHDLAATYSDSNYRDRGQLANAIPREFRESGQTQLIGKRVRNTQDLATIAQVYRDPRFETFRWIFTKDNKVVGELGVSSRMPANTQILPAGVDDLSLADIKNTMAALDADGYYIMHNHPSGQSAPSTDDIHATRYVARNVEGFHGHVVINHKEYSVLDETGQVSTHTLKTKKIGYDLKNPENRIQNHPVLGAAIDSPKAVANIYSQIVHTPGYIVIIAADVRGNVRSVFEISPAEVSQSLPRIAARLKRIGVDTGSGWLFAAGLDKYRLSSEHFKAIETAINRGLLIDAIYEKGGSFRGDNPMLQGDPNYSLWRNLNEGPYRIVKDDSALFQSADQPFGAYDEASQFRADSQVMDEGWRVHVRPLLDAMQDGALNQLKEIPLDGATRDMSPAGQAMLRKYMKQVTKSDMPTSKLATMRWAEKQTDFAMLNYNKRYGADRIAEARYPYELYLTRTGVNWLARAVDKPALYSNFARAYMQTHRYERDIPERLRNKIKIPAPWLPDWAGDALYIDPLSQLFPPAAFLRPFERRMQDKNYQQIEAERVLQEWAQDGTYTQQQILEAAQTHSGTTWERAFAEAQSRRESELANPIDFLDSFFGPAWYQTTPYKLAMGEGKSLSTLPLTNTARAIDTVTQGTWAEPVGNAIGLISKFEDGLRHVFKLPTLGEYEDYYTKRQVANGVAEGKYDSDAAQMAMIEKTGPIWDEARERVKMELALRVPTMGALYAGLHEGPVAAAQAFVPSLFGAGLLPSGELEFRGDKQEWDEAWKRVDAGDQQAVSNFFDEHPEYEAYLAKGKDDPELLRSFLIGQIWDGYMALGPTNQRQARAEMGDLFSQAFLDKETRSYDTLDLQTLTDWTRLLNGMVPKVPETTTATAPASAEHPSSSLNLYDPYVTETTDRFFQQRTAKFPNYYELQQKYYSLATNADKSKFLLDNPEYAEYVKWRKRWYDQYPQYKSIFNGDAFDRVDTRTWPPMLEDFVRMYAMTGQRLPNGAFKSLEQVWIREGQPMGDFQTWLNSTVVPSMLYGEGIMQ